MILFKSDWDLFPESILHTSTKNVSYVRLAGLLKGMGVENHAFFLALHNPLLEHIDPYDPNLTETQIMMISKEAKENPWYIFREIIKVPAIAGPDNLPLKANRANISLFWLFFNHVTTMLLQPRQTGKSISTDALNVALFGILTVYTDIQLLTKDDDLRVKNVKRIKDLYDSLPYYLKLRSRGDTYNTEKLTISRLHNSYQTAVAQPSRRGALNLGRGMTIPINHIDEIAFIVNISLTLPALLAATGAARDIAAEAGAEYGNIFTTTAGYLNTESGQYAYEIYSESMRWSEKLFDCKDQEELYDVIKKNSPGKKVQVVLDYNHRQLGYTDEWLARKISEARSEGENAEADYLNKWAAGNSESPIDKQYLKLINASIIPDPYNEISKQGYILKWYAREAEIETKFRNRILVTGIDTSDAIGNDDIAVNVRCATSAEVLGAGTYNETNLILFSEWLVQLLLDYPNMILVIERKSSGVAIIDNLLKLLPLYGVDPFSRLFNWVVNDAEMVPSYMSEVIKVPFNRRDSMVYTKYRKEFGYATAGAGRASRDNLYSLAFNPSIKYTSTVVRDRVLINQLNGLIRKNGRIDHGPKDHDDSVIAWLLAYWFLSEAKNKPFYGLNNSMVLTGVLTTIVNEAGGEEAYYNKIRQNRIRQTINELIIQLKAEKDPVISNILINKIKHMYKDITSVNGEVLNIDTLIENINLEKRKYFK
jgi:hypothetical protein